MRPVPAKKLNPEQEADAARLKALWLAWKAAEVAAGRPIAQDAAAERLGFGQSAFSQYLNGIIPLNADALRKFCALLEVRPARISPKIAAEERARVLAWLAADPAPMPKTSDYKTRSVHPATAAKTRKTR